MRPDKERVQNLLRDTVTTLCRNSLLYSRGMKVQGLLGITLDDDDVFIVHFNEIFQGVGTQEVTIQQADSVNLGIETPHSDLEVSSAERAIGSTMKIPVVHGGRSRRKAQPWRAIGGLSEPTSSKGSTDNDFGMVDTIKQEDEQSNSFPVDDNDDDNILGATYSMCDYAAEDEGGDVDIMKQSYMETMKEDVKTEEHQHQDINKNMDTDNNFTAQGGPFISGIVQDFTGMEGLATDKDDASSYQFDSSQDQAVDLSGGAEAIPSHMMEGLPDGIEWDQYHNPPVNHVKAKRPRQMATLNNNRIKIRNPSTPSNNNSGEPSAINNNNINRKRRLPSRLNNLKALHKCKDCGKTYWSRNTLVRHQKVHNPNLYVCKKCTLFFPSEDRLLAHDRAKHSGPIWGRYKCDVCNKKFRSSNHLVGHMNTFHTKPQRENWTDNFSK